MNIPPRDTIQAGTTKALGADLKVGCYGLTCTAGSDRRNVLQTEDGDGFNGSSSRTDCYPVSRWLMQPSHVFSTFMDESGGVYVLVGRFTGAEIGRGDEWTYRLRVGSGGDRRFSLDEVLDVVEVVFELAVVVAFGDRFGQAL